MGHISVIKGNIFNTHCQTIVNTVNCVGVMGKGIALVFKLRYPDMFRIYQDYCNRGLIEIGKLWLYKSENPLQPWVLNFPTKTHWKLPSEYSYVEAGLKKFVDTYKEKGITSIAFPLLGTNNGGLDRDVVLRMMMAYLETCDIPVEIYDFDPAAPDDLFESFKAKWNSIDPANRKKITGIRTKKQLQVLDEQINNPETKSMMQLLNIDGVGYKTMACCFDVVMKYVKPQNLFEL